MTVDKLKQLTLSRGRGGGLVDRAADSGPSSIPLDEKKENKRKEARVGPFKKSNKHLIKMKLL